MAALHRLKQNELLSIVRVIQNVIPAGQLQAIWLFGSKARLDAKGGDIDLWIECLQERAIDPVWPRRIRMRLEEELGEQKIDLVLAGPESEIEDRQKRAFLETLHDQRVALWKKNPQS